MFRRLPILFLIPLSFTGVACGGGDEPLSDGEPPAPTTAPPTTAPPTSVPEPTPPTSNPPPDAELPERYVEIDDGAFDNLGDMCDEAEVIVVATVTGEEPIGPGRDDVNPPPEAHLGLRLSVDEVLKGDPGDEVRLAWHAYALDDDGDRVAVNVLNGIPVPHEGDQLVLFLRQIDEQSADWLGGFPTHGPVMLDGIGFVESGVVTITDSVSPTAAVLTGASLDDVRASL